MLDRLMTRLAYSRLLTVRFQVIHLIINYSILALSCAVYLVFNTSEWVIGLGSLPGAIVFIMSVQALSYRKAIEGDDPFELMRDMLGRGV